MYLNVCVGGMGNQEGVDLGEFLTDLAHELFYIVKGLTKNKKN